MLINFFSLLLKLHMATSLKEFHFLIILCLLFIHFSLAQDGNQFIYNGFQGANLHLDGIAKIHPNGLLQLTNTSKQQMGHAFYRIPLSFNTYSSGLMTNLSFSTNFVFAMVPELPNLGGHGIAFTISPTMNFSHALQSQFFGIFNPSNWSLPANHVVAIELDTSMSIEFEDIDKNHVGVDVNSPKSIEAAPTSYFSDKERKNISLELISGNPMQLWIDYDEAEKTLNVTIAPVKIPKPNRPLLSTAIDLSQILLEYMYVGFSSSTGTFASDHYILGWSFNKSGQAQSLEISKLPSLPPQKRKKKSFKMILILPLAAAVVLIIVIGASYFIRSKKYEEVLEEWETEYGPHRFSYKNLYRATNGFKERELLGRGGFGKVYRGKLHNSNQQIAVKRVSHDSKQGMKEFVAEIASIGRLRHRNLVQLLGYCRRRGELLLVYDYMPNGSLDKFLFNNVKPNLNWFQRFRILKGVASALLYLHEEWEQVVLHRDVKASNVLLDADLNGRLGDFGLARLYDHGSNPQTTHVVGTLGYLAPELARTGKATTSTDVFAFGIFMLEVACGRRPTNLQGVREGVILLDWVLECWKGGAILDASDPKLEGNYLTKEMELVLKLGLLCSHPLPEMRPSMRQVLQYFDGDATLQEMQPDSLSINTSTESNEALQLVMSFGYSFGKYSAHSLSSNESILDKTR
ncbi:L-type lectin-domain containing receptor kinase SIT2-like [Ziziphus jujuba]|uniref:L-type lectin-domain containing receptor kinase SIT2-like n=1 Tax=Ziziphus jujuba TaxID=326968 RepID=A0A6P3Z976_ZIZJJ|nr:L-type lectin-domain containing receptor kinase SIT2-like [Ziziphus jujuba]